MSQSTSLDEEKYKFIERVIKFLNRFREECLNYQEYQDLFDAICGQFDKNPEELVSPGLCNTIAQSPLLRLMPGPTLFPSPVIQNGISFIPLHY